MRKDFQEIQKDSLVDELINVIDYAEGEVETNEDGLGREYAEIKVNWDETIVRIFIEGALRRHNVHYRKDERSMARAERIFDFVKGEDRKDLMCFVFGLMESRMTRSDVEHMICYAKKTRDWRREIEAEKETK